jgi:hypothetical protein
MAAGAVSGAQKLALMADKAKTQLQQTEAEVSAQRGSEQAMVARCVCVMLRMLCAIALLHYSQAAVVVSHSGCSF